MSDVELRISHSCGSDSGLSQLGVALGQQGRSAAPAKSQAAQSYQLLGVAWVTHFREKIQN